MEQDKYDKVIEKMPEIAKMVSSFPEKVQDRAFDLLVSTLIGGVTVSKPRVEREKTLETAKAKTIYPQSALAGVAMKTNEGNFHFSVRDLKASSATDAAKRLTYVLIRSYTELMNEETASRKEIINPHMQSWRLNSGNTRNFLANDPGIVRNGDKYSLDIHAEKEADEFIAEIQDSSITGSWKPNSRVGPKKKNQSKEKDESTI